VKHTIKLFFIGYLLFGLEGVCSEKEESKPKNSIKSLSNLSYSRVGKFTVLDPYKEEEKLNNSSQDLFFKAFQKFLRELDGVLVIKGRTFPFASLPSFTSFVESSASAGAGSSGGGSADSRHPVPSSSAGAVREEEKTAPIHSIFGFEEIHPNLLFGSDGLVSIYATKGYTFWSKTPTLISGTLEEQKIQFQQALGARYVFADDIQEDSILPDAVGDEVVLNALTPHVVLTTKSLEEEHIRKKVYHFFSVTSAAVCEDSSDACIFSSEGEKSTKKVAKSQANAIAVVDIEANEDGVLNLGAPYNQLDYPAILNSIQHLIVTTTSDHATTIGTFFLYQCDNLISVDLRGLQNIIKIEDCFIYDCSQLINVDLRDFQNVETIGRCFLATCDNLSFVDLRGFQRLRDIESHFLMYSRSLKFVDLAPLHRITNIPHGFFYECPNLISLDLRPLRNAKTIGCNFLYNCTGLTSIDLGWLQNVLSIGNSFLYGCTNLISVDLRGFQNVTEIDYDFLSNCPLLATTLDTIKSQDVPKKLHPKEKLAERVKSYIRTLSPIGGTK
jgi:hypothetical protein